jgi:hypothetical protein
LRSQSARLELQATPSGPVRHPEQYTLEASTAAGGPELGSAQTTFRRQRMEQRAVEAQDIFGSERGRPDIESALESLIRGTVRELRTIGYAPDRLCSIGHSLFEYGKHAQTLGKQPDFMDHVKVWIQA